MASDKVFTVAEPMTLLPFLISKMPGKGRNKVKALLTHRLVEVENKIVTRHDHPLQPGQRITILGGSNTVQDSLQGIRILFEDADLLVIDKPPGLLSIATDEEREHTAYHVLTEHVRVSNPQHRVFVVHRLDRETSGVMMFAKREAIQQSLQDAWKDVVLERTYLAVVERQFKKTEGTIKSWLKESSTRTMYVSSTPGDGLKAVTHYRVLQTGADYSLLEVQLETGRKNQIRVHMQSLGHSVVGDKRYGSTKDPMGRLGLHARVLSFRHPVTEQVLRFETEIPQAFRKLFPGS
jgi:23S rRNA pseudouridine1911/1915/1917 synthase